MCARQREKVFRAVTACRRRDDLIIHGQLQITTCFFLFIRLEKTRLDLILIRFFSNYPRADVADSTDGTNLFLNSHPRGTDSHEGSGKDEQFNFLYDDD